MALSLGLSKCEMAQATGKYSLSPANLRIDPADTVATKQRRTTCKNSNFFIMMIYSQMAAHGYFSKFVRFKKEYYKRIRRNT
jgi:hypothetical protein